jgi:hypothetical protein
VDVVYIFDDILMDNILKKLTTTSECEDLIITSIISKSEELRIMYKEYSDDIYQKTIVPYLVIVFKNTFKEHIVGTIWQSYDDFTIPKYLILKYEQDNDFQFFSALHDYYLEVLELETYFDNEYKPNQYYTSIGSNLIDKKPRFNVILSAYAAYCDYHFGLTSKNNFKLKEDDKYISNYPDINEFYDNYIGNNFYYKIYVEQQVEKILQGYEELLNHINYETYGESLIKEGEDVFEIRNHYFKNL